MPPWPKLPQCDAFQQRATGVCFFFLNRWHLLRVTELLAVKDRCQGLITKGEYNEYNGCYGKSWCGSHGVSRAWRSSSASRNSTLVILHTCMSMPRKRAMLAYTDSSHAIDLMTHVQSSSHPWAPPLLCLRERVHYFVLGTIYCGNQSTIWKTKLSLYFILYPKIMFSSIREFKSALSWLSNERSWGKSLAPLSSQTEKEGRDVFANSLKCTRLVSKKALKITN